MLLVKAIVVSLLFATIAYSYLIGTGISDITGPSTEINFMGYAVPSQRGSGIHLRLRSRAFIIADEDTGTNEQKKKCLQHVIYSIILKLSQGNESATCQWMGVWDLIW